MEMAQFILAPLTALDLFGYIIITEEFQFPSHWFPRYE